MRICTVRLKERSYDILIGDRLLNRSGAILKKLFPDSSAYTVTNNFILKTYGTGLTQSLSKCKIGIFFKKVGDSEKSKSLSTVAAVIKDLTRHKNKNVFIAAFGGGVIGDLSGFIASLYRRGLAYVQIPTTLLAQVDSSIGGKTAVDLAEGKNLIGAFHQPKVVICDTSLLKTLPKRQIQSGLAEVIKYGVINDKSLFAFLEKNLSTVKALNPKTLEYIVFRCAKIKASIVSADEREEKGLRTILNFGHTLGHAIETAGGFKKYNHGEAVGLGMLIATDISVALHLLPEKSQKRISALISQTGLPQKIEGISLSQIIKAHYHDKKFKGAQNTFVLIRKIGSPVIRKNIPLEIIKTAVKNRLA